ncbi:tetratricopeptide (TPR) repeat protein [Actinoplanes octamycinicus]|uniref:Tetratricopeptide (TPR) repeat protein n=1 Tax=Actinoplanes octamycinicus TaxID=135948 RepID=A0A7W7H2A2_9ACTN|nr:tetratricopeptide repeat protein [Actinoplanes octamycinicus]MBB4742499.1 tetratricopeptide (TPR) repeat protein [Actinoplanes octamycinicus]
MTTSTGEVFISCAAEDREFAADLRRRLEELRIPVWAGPRELRPGSRPDPEAATAVARAGHVLVVLSPSTVNSPQVRREIAAALARTGDGVRVIPLLLPGITPDALDLWFPERPLAVPVEAGPGGLSVALPALLAALGRQAPDDPQAFALPAAKPVEELILKLTDPRMETVDGWRRARATATLIYEPARPGARDVESLPFPFTAPLGPIETADLRWYLEEYHLWPVGQFTRRADGIQKRLPSWGGDLYAAALADEEAWEALTAWQHAAGDADRRFSVMVYGDLPRAAGERDQAAAREAATELLSLPWELLHDGRGWLFQGREPVRVRRRLPNRRRQPDRPTELPVRILLVSPRPEVDRDGDPIAYLDHRTGARPLVEALENLGELARLTILQPPTYAGLQLALQEGDQGFPYDVVHFDGHGAIGTLSFEDPADRERRRVDVVDAAQLAGLVRRHRIPLVLLEACRTAMSEMDPTASVAARLLDEGVTSVVAMSHSVLVETARRFVQSFYAELARGARVGAAMLAGQQELYADRARGRVLGAGELRLQDWFVPVLYQEEQDPQLITKVPPDAVLRLEAKRRRYRLGDLPDPPEHRFRGRGRELLALERLLHRHPWAVVRGIGGQGKTALAVELARWLVRSGRFERAAFVGLDRHRDARAVLDTLGRQLAGPRYTVAQYPDLDLAVQPVARALADHTTVVVVDNGESAAAVPEIFDLCRGLLDADPGTRLIFTSRESLPAPFDRLGRERELGALDRPDAVDLVGEVMKQHGWTPPEEDAGEAPQQVTDLVEAVGRHARALVLLAREVARRGVTATTADLRSLMAHLDERHPGDRENSLYASVELSLRRLSPLSREHVPAVAVCPGGVHLSVLEAITGLRLDGARQLATELIEVGLAEDLDNGHLGLDPALAPYLLGELRDKPAADLRERWADAMLALTARLRRWEFTADADRARELTVLELPNLLGMLDVLAASRPAQEVVAAANHVVALVEDLGRPGAVARAIRVRDQARPDLTGWSEARFDADVTDIFRLVDDGELPAALTAARRLVDRCLAAGEDAYPHAAHDIAAAYHHLGQVVMEGNDPEAALVPFAEARRRAEALPGEDGDGLDIAVVADIGSCMLDLGRLIDAGAAFEEAVARSTRAGEVRAAAIHKAGLGSVRLEQFRYAEALRANEEARDTFQALGEPLMVAGYWYQIGHVHVVAGRPGDAEHAFRESLAIRVREGDLTGQAACLLGLGDSYGMRGRFEDAAAFAQQAADVFVQLNDVVAEGVARGNLAGVLIGLGRYEEGRREIERAFECFEPYGAAVQPWKIWSTLERLERAAGRTGEASAARKQAMDLYLAYRESGGMTQAPLGPSVMFFVQHISRHGRQQALRVLDEAEPPDRPPWPVFRRQMRAVLTRDRDQLIAGEDDLDCLDAVELRILDRMLDGDSQW